MKLAIFLLSAATVASAQTIEGNVVDAVTGAPVAGAMVSLYSFSPSPAVFRTDASGHFSLPGFDDGSIPPIVLSISKAGYLQARYQLSSKSAQSGLQLQLMPTAVIAGKLSDDDGFPVDRAHIAALCYRFADGVRELATKATAESNDLGEYRIFNLPPGRYLIRVSPGNLANWDRRYQTEYLPGSLEPSAESWIEVKAGEERAGIDMRLTRHEGVSVEGRVVLPPGRIVSLSLQEKLEGAAPIYFGRTANPFFHIPHVPPGNYRLRAQSGSFSLRAGDLIAEQEITVAGADIRDLVLNLGEVKPMDLSGVVAEESGGVPPTMLINLRTTLGTSQTVRSDSKGTFTFRDLLPGQYHLQLAFDVTASGPGDHAAMPSYPISALLGEKEVLMSGFGLDGPAGPLKITLSNRLEPRVTGNLRDAAGQAVPGAVVVIESANLLARRMTVTDTAGDFQLYPRFAGDYHVYVAASLDQADSLSDPDYINAHRNDFPPLRLVEGQNPPLTLRLPAR
ncbi:MAG: carboxypeptidase regulatory-like domain-containing protein [Bryobacteraceae bacterium]|jgi:hypothetical protein